MNIPLPPTFTDGLREDLPDAALMPGMAKVADDVDFYNSTGPRTRPGFTKILKEFPPPIALRLDGRTTGVITDILSTGSALHFDTLTRWTFAMRFQVNALPGDNRVLYSFSDRTVAASNAALEIRIEPDGQDYKLSAYVSDSTPTHHSVQSPTKILPGVCYEVWVSRNTDIDQNLAIKVDSASWTTAASSAVLGYQVTGKPAIIGAHVVAQGGRTDAFSPLSELLKLDVHRIRIWNSEYQASTQTPDNEWRFTDSSSTHSDKLGSGPDFKAVAAWPQDPQEHRWDMLPSTGSWETDSPIIGNASLKLNGFCNVLRVPNAYRYRRVIYDDQNEAWNETNEWALMFQIKFTTVSECVIAHMCPVRTASDWGARDPSDTFYFKVGVNGSSQFYISAGQGDNTFTSLAGDNAISADTRYLVYVSRDADTTAKIRLKVTADGSTWLEDKSTNCGKTYTDPTTGDEEDHDDLRGWKYAYVIGGGISDATYITAQYNVNDPEGFRLKIDWTSVPEALIDSYAHIIEEDVTVGAGRLSDAEIFSFWDHQWRTTQITAKVNQQRFRSYWVFDEGQGDVVEDRGLLGNHLDIRTDGDYLFCENQSSFDVDEEAPAKLTAVTESWKPIAGGQRKMIVATDAAVYEVDESAGSLTKVGEGMRNDSGGSWRTLPFGQSLLFAGEWYPFRFVGSDVYPLGVEQFPATRVMWGLHAQGQEYAFVDMGVRRYRFVFYSSYTGEEGGWSSEIRVPIFKGNKAIVAFGSDAGEGGSPTLPRVRQRSARVDGDNPGPYDLTDGDAGAFVAAEMKVTVGATEALSELYVVRIERKHVDNPESASLVEIKTQIDRQVKMGYAKVITLDDAGSPTTSTEETIQVHSSAVGQDAALRIQNPTAGTGITNLRTIIGLSPTTVVKGTDGDISETPLPLPIRSTHATHIRAYRTARGGSTFYRVIDVPLGSTPAGSTAGFYAMDNVPDDELTRYPTMDPRHGTPPKCSMMAELNSRVVYSGHPDYPWRLWWSLPGRPETVIPTDFIDLLDGRTLAITALERFAGSIMVFKENTTIMARSIQSRIFPFRFDARDQDVGAAGRGAVAVSSDGIVCGGSAHPTLFDSIRHRSVGRGVSRSWQAIAADDLEEVQVVHHVLRQEALFANPGDVEVYCMSSGGWCKWKNIEMRAIARIKGDRTDELYFSDSYGNLFKLEGYSDGGNLVEDEMSQPLYGTGFTISSDTIQLTGFTCSTSDSVYLRGLYVRIVDSNLNEETIPVLYVSASNTLKLASAPTLSTDASGSWYIGAIHADWRGGEIGDGIWGMMVDTIAFDQETESGWPTGHSTTLYAQVQSGAVDGGAIEKSIPVAVSDVAMGFGFHCRKFSLGVKMKEPKKPFKAAGFQVEVIPQGRGRPI